MDFTRPESALAHLEKGLMQQLVAATELKQCDRAAAVSDLGLRQFGGDIGHVRFSCGSRLDFLDFERVRAFPSVATPTGDHT